MARWGDARNLPVAIAFLGGFLCLAGYAGYQLATGPATPRIALMAAAGVVMSLFGIAEVSASWHARKASGAEPTKEPKKGRKQKRRRR